MPNWKKVVVSGSAANLHSLNVSTDVTASNISSSGNIFGNLSENSSTSFKTVVVDPSTGQFYRTGSYGTGGGGGGGSAFPFTGDAQITGSLIVSGALQLDYNGNDNIIIGSGSGEVLDSGTNNIIFGNNAATSLTTGGSNLIIGHRAGKSTALNQESGNTLIGIGAGEDGTYDANYGSNTFIGYNAGKSSAAMYSTFVGSGVGQGTTSFSVAMGANGTLSCTAAQSVALGYGSQTNGTNNYNVSLGTSAMRSGNGGSLNQYNVALGYQAQYTSYRLNNSISIGAKAAYGTSYAKDDIFIGHEAVYSYVGNTTGRNLIIGYQAGYDLGDASTHNILIGEGVGAENVVLEKQLKIGSGSLITISASLATGDIIFPSTASADYFVGDGSQLTNLPAASAGSTAGRVVFTTTNGELTSETGFTYDATTDRLTVPNLTTTTFTASFITSSTIETSGSNIFGDEAGVDIQTLIGTTKMTGSAQITGNTQITGSLLVAGANSGIAPTTSSLKIDSNGYFYHLGRYVGNATNFANNQSNTVIGNNITSDGDYYNTIIGESAGVGSTTNQTAIGRGAIANVASSTAIGSTSKAYGVKSTSIGMGAGSTTSKGLNIGYYARGTGAKNIVLNASEGTVGPTKANTFGIYMTGTSPNFEIEATGSSTLSGSSFTIEKSGSTVFEVIGSEGTLFSVDDDLDGTIFTANDRTGLPVLEASASGEVYIGKNPQSLYTTAVISSTTADVTQSLYGLDTSSYGGAFFDYIAHSGSNARGGTVSSVWTPGGSVVFSETTTTHIGDTSNLNLVVHFSQSQAQLACYADTSQYNIKVITRAI